MAFGLVETGLISMALRLSTSPASASATSFASFARNRACVGFEKSGDQSFAHVTLSGPADFVFEGEIEI